MQRSSSLADTENIAREFLKTLTPELDRATIVALSGELGSGKTTFVKMFAKALGVEESVTSPTFVIEKIYKLTGSDFERLIHIDAYRFERVQEIEVLGWRELIEEPTNLICIEWPERVPAAIPEGAIIISFTSIDETMRDIDISYGQRK